MKTVWMYIFLWEEKVFMCKKEMIFRVNLKGTTALK